MMKLYKALLLLVFFTPTLLIANNGVKKHEKTKTIKKQFSVNSKATLYINNKYGNINISSWNENRVEIDVKITVKGSNLSKVEDKLNAINVDFNASNELVEARTRIQNTKSNWSWWGGNDNINFKINYFIKMPASNNADLHNKYGNIEIDVLNGKSNINCSYGNIEIDKLTNADNSINLDYCGSSDINYIKSGHLSLDYSKLKIQNSEKLKSSSDYSSLKIEKVGSLNFNSDYGSVSVSNVDIIEGNSDYAGVKVGTLHKKLRIDTDYGGVKIYDIAKGFESIAIEANYAGVKLGTKSDNSFKFIVDLGYAGFNYPNDKVEFFKSIKKSSKKYYEGTFGSENSNATVNIRSRYGGVSLKITD
ncbi:hypothetical protein [Tenacibaculum sp. 190524A02b]